MINYKKYTYLKDGRGKYYNPFSQGVAVNVLEFFGCTLESRKTADRYCYD